MSSRDHDYRCPLCRQIDMVQRVRALVEGGTVAGIYSNTAGARVSALTLSAKASQLAPPQQPTYESSWSCLSIIPIGLGLFFLIGSCYALLNGFSQGGAFVMEHAGWAFFWFVVAVVSLLCIVLPIGYHGRQDQKRRIQYDAEMLRWKRATNVWDQLYYCARNDVVFLPDNPDGYVSSSDMSRLLYR